MLSNEDRRVNELFKYYQPHQSRRQLSASQRNGRLSYGSVKGGEVDSTLTALCQLAAIRLDVLRVGISLLSDTRQYILAESTTTRDLSDANQEVMVADGGWGGFMECDRVGGLCDLTVRCPPPSQSQPHPCLTIPDLRQSNWKEAPFVAGPPFMKFYCGTPITTEHGFNIGSFYAVDNRLLGDFSPQQKKLFKSLATLVMGQLEARRETSERLKTARMGKALSAFVNADVPQTDEDASEASETPQEHSSEESSQTLPSGGSDSDNVDDADKIATPPPESKENSERIYEDRNHVFARASALIRDALEVEGCVFFDCAEAVLAGVDPDARTDDPHETRRADTEAPELFLQRRGSVPDYLAALPASGTPTVEILSFSLNDRSTLNKDNPESAFQDLKIKPFDEKSLMRLLKQYPRGMLWSFGEDGAKPTQPVKSRRGVSSEALKFTGIDRPGEAETQSLLSRFPGIRHLLFVPLFDVSLGRANAGCFAFTYQRSITFSTETELSFVRNFMNNMGAELARIDAVQLSSSKTDFISSISHELRSPLHGILAAAEFLEDTPISNYQKSLISTQISCGRTLLHVIEHVLDYSKINSFTKDEQSASDGGKRSGGLMKFGSGMQNLYEKTDIAELVEEVVEGSVAGRTLASSDPSLQLVRNATKSEEEPVFGFVKNVAVILDFDYQYDWVYITQPGAVRRILMNILGNSLKYTAAGCIRVRLKVGHGPGDQDPTDDRTTIQLTVSDTGRGISREFLRKRLFTAFQQEDHLSTGCGLGLSIVKSLVDGLGGKLEIKSEQNIGTTVSVKLPLSRGSKEDVDTVRRSSHTSTKGLTPLATHGMSVCYVGFVGFKERGIIEPAAGKREAKIKETIHNSVAKCMVDWLKMTPLLPDQGIDEADYVVILADERLRDFTEPYGNNMKKKQPRVIALIPSEMTRSTVETALSDNIKAFEIMSAPFGPRKVALAVSACEKAAETWSGRTRTHVRAQEVSIEDVQVDVQSGSKILEEEAFITKAGDDKKPLKEIGNLLEVPNARPIMTPLATSEEGQLPLLQKRPVTSNTPKLHRLLLVDDNQINVRLLETFVRKRRPGCQYDTAENGLQAVEAAQLNTEGYSIIFMDISMPVMDGLEATKRIRALEKERRSNKSEDTAGPSPAMIVALTGLANSRDQQNSFAAGVDLFMTKPAKFKEIGKLLDDFFKEP